MRGPSLGPYSLSELCVRTKLFFLQLISYLSHLKEAGLVEDKRTTQLSPTQIADPQNNELNKWSLFQNSKLWGDYNLMKVVAELARVSTARHKSMGQLFGLGSFPNDKIIIYLYAPNNRALISIKHQCSQVRESFSKQKTWKGRSNNLFQQMT